ncbi:MAG: hypothetical protein AB7J32_02725 [Pseudonocardia sp.]
MATLSVAAAGLWSVPALAASEEGGPDKAACAEPAPRSSPLAALGLGSSPDEASSKQACNSQKRHVDRSGQTPAGDAESGAAADAGDTAGTDAGTHAGTDAAGTDEPGVARADGNSTSTMGRGAAPDAEPTGSSRSAGTNSDPASSESEDAPTSGTASG